MSIWYVLEYTASVAVVGLLIWLVKLIFHDKLDARWHYFIWLVLLVRLAVPVQIALPPASISIFREIPLGRWREMCEILAQKRGYGGLSGLLFGGYVLGAGILGLFYLIVWTVLRIQVCRAAKADGETRAYVDGIAEKYGLKTCRDICLRRTGTPYICGLFRPVLVLPEDNPMPEEPVIVHELLHRKYRDVLVNIGLHAVRVANWFNPVVWLLTSAVQNDGEALCDQRVLEYCGGENARAYGELLIAMGNGKKAPVKVGTSNLASSRRNMKTRIRRIRDFRKVPKETGLAALCITLILAVAGIGSSAEETHSFRVLPVSSEADLEKALLYAECYHARTPQEAVWLFLRAVDEKSTVYRMSVMPRDEIPQYEKYAAACLGGRYENGWAEPVRESGEVYPPYFPEEMSGTEEYRVYNLQYNEERGTAAVCAKLTERGDPVFVEWKLALLKEDGWKVWLEEESGRFTGEYDPEPLLSGSSQLGDFLVQASAYNEGIFAHSWGYQPEGGVIFFTEEDGEREINEFPDYFSMEYRYERLDITYQGEESLEGRRVKVVVTNGREEEPDGEQAHFESWTIGSAEGKPESAAAEGSTEGETKSTLTAEGSILEDDDLAWIRNTMGEEELEKALSADSYSYTSSDGTGGCVFDGAELMAGESRIVLGEGSGFSEPGYVWTYRDEMKKYVRIYIDGVLKEEGEVWSKSH